MKNLFGFFCTAFGASFAMALTPPHELLLFIVSAASLVGLMITNRELERKDRPCPTTKQR